MFSLGGGILDSSLFFLGSFSCVTNDNTRKDARIVELCEGIARPKSFDLDDDASWQEMMACHQGGRLCQVKNGCKSRFSARLFSERQRTVQSHEEEREKQRVDEGSFLFLSFVITFFCLLLSLSN